MIISKNTKIFLAIFSAFLLAITIVAVIYKNNHKTSNGSQVIIESSQKIPDISEETINAQNSNTVKLTLDDTYSNNGLQYELVDDPDKNIEVSYIQISGLKNESVQEDINTQIKERINKILDSNNFKNNSDDTAYVTASVQSNFSDVLSIRIFVQFTESYKKYYGLNFRLDNGERIKLDDIFTYDAPKKNIITNSAYRSFALSYYTDEGISNEFYTNIEDDLVNFMTDYEDGKITEFSFTPLTVELYRDGKTVTIDMAQYYEYISVYKSFISDSELYDSTDGVASKIPVLVKRPEALVDLYEKVSDSCIIDVIIYSDENTTFSSKEKKAIQNYTSDLKERLSSAKTSKGIYYSNYVKVTKSTENGDEILVFTEEECFVNVDEEEFLNDIYPQIIMAERDLNNLTYEKSKIHILDDDILESAVIEKKYKVSTGKEITEEDEIVEEDTDAEDSTEGTDNENEQSSGTENQSPSPSTSQTAEPSTETNTSPSTSPSQSGEVTTRVYY